MQNVHAIQSRILEVRGERVMLDYDLAILYEVPTKVLNQAVKRNLSRFPVDFMFRLTDAEWKQMRSQVVTASQRKRNAGVTPYAFTEQGVAMLSSVLGSLRAIEMNIAIMRTFVEIRKMLVQENVLLDQKAAEQQWEERRRIGFIS